METKSQARYKDITAFQSVGGPIVAFHSTRLEVAQITPELFAELQNPGTHDELANMLETWNAETALPRRTKAAATVRSLTLNVTQVCNLHCTYCAAGGDGTYGDPVKKIAIDRTLPQLEYFLTKADPGQEFRLTFLGGEPLLYPDGIQMIYDHVSEIAQSRGVRLQIVVVTNGTLFTEKNIALLAYMKADISISLDGSAEVNDKLRPTVSGRGATAAVVAGIEKLMQSKTELGTVGVSGVFGKHNPNLLAAYEFYRGLGVTWFDFTYDHLEKEAQYSEDFARQLSQIAGLAFAAGGEASLRQIKLFDGFFTSLDNQILNENYCGAGKSFLMIDARNNLFTCPWDVGQNQHMVGTGTHIWPDKIQAYAEDLVEQNKCGNCWARFMCGGGCMFIHKNKTGDKHSVDSNFCNRTRHLLETTILYYERSRSKTDLTSATLSP